MGWIEPVLQLSQLESCRSARRLRKLTYAIE